MLKALPTSQIDLIFLNLYPANAWWVLNGAAMKYLCISILIIGIRTYGVFQRTALIVLVGLNVAWISSSCVATECNNECIRN